MVRNETGQALCQLLRSSRADVPDETTSILDTMAALAKHGKTSLRVECQYATYDDCLADGRLNLMDSSDIIRIILNLLQGSDDPVKTSGLAVIKYLIANGKFQVHVAATHSTNHTSDSCRQQLRDASFKTIVTDFLESAASGAVTAAYLGVISALSEFGQSSIPE